MYWQSSIWVSAHYAFIGLVGALHRSPDTTLLSTFSTPLRDVLDAQVDSYKRQWFFFDKKNQNPNLNVLRLIMVKSLHGSIYIANESQKPTEHIS